MRVYSRRTLREFWTLHRGAEKPLRVWYRIVEDAAWKTPSEVKLQFGHASFVRECVIFNIGGNKFRVVTWIDYGRQTVMVKGVFTHEEYDEADIDCRR